jgi:hypothetical protein
MRYDLAFIFAGLACLLIGESFGAYMGAQQDFTLEPAHAHLNLVGGVTLTAFGLIHRAYPGLARSRLALAQMIIAIAGAVTLPVGIALTILNINHVVVIAGALIVISGTLLFLLLFSRKANLPGTA